MIAQGVFAAKLIDSATKALAAGAVARLGEALEGGDAPIEFRALVADAEARLRTLAEALAVGRPELLRLDVLWLSETYRARGLPRAYLLGSLRGLRAELAEALPADASGLACAYLDDALEHVAEPPSAPVESNPLAARHGELASRFLLAVLEGRRDDAQRMVLAAFDGGATVPDLHANVIRWAQTEMGRMWQEGEVHAAEEHLASRIVEETLVLLRSRMPIAPSNGRSVLIASVHGNQHEIGARLVADQFEMAGWRALFLGADTPTTDLVAAVGQFRASLVALSAGLGLNVRATAELVESIHAECPGVPVIVGGGPFSRIPDLWESVGADGGAADAAGAVREGERLCAKP